MAHAADVTVCDTACDYTTITDAIAGGGFSSGDSIFVGADYASTTETFPFNIPTGVNLDCQNSGAMIGIDDENNPVNVHPQSDNIFRNCQYSNVSINSNNQSDIQILNNTFFENSHISTNNVTSITATGNLGLMGINVGNTVGAIIDSNTINSLAYIHGNAFQVSNSTSVQFTRNIITDSVTSTPTGDQIIGISGDSFDIYFASNTVLMPYSTFSGGGLSVLEITDSRKITVRDNLFSMSANGGGIQVLNFNGSGGDISIDAQHNTIKMNDPCNNCSGILMTSWDVSDVTVTSSYNLIVATTPSSTASMSGHSSYGAGPASSLHLYTDHEGFAGLNVLDTTDFPIASNSTVRRYNPFKIDDAISTNDFELVPYAAFLDVNGTEDIGAVAGMRGSEFHINASGMIDYVSVDATNTTVVMDSLRDFDTTYLASGVYSPFILQSSSQNVPLTGNINIIGTGAGTIIQATSSGNVLTIINLVQSSFQDIVVTGATSTHVENRTITRSQFTDGVTTYDQGAFIGIPNAVIIVTGAPGGGTCATVTYNLDGFDVSSIVAAAPTDWNVGLVDYLGFKLTIFSPEQYVPDAATLPGCGNPGEITVEHFVDSIYTYTSGELNYNSAAATLAGITPKTGETIPPAITHNNFFTGFAGIVLNGATNNTFTNVTSTNNAQGVNFTTTASGNVFTDSTLTGNAGYDILDSASGNNVMQNTRFNAASSSITGNGAINAFFKGRAFVHDALNAPLAGVSVTFQSADGSTSTLFTTNAAGYTPYFTSPLPAFILTSSTLAQTAGGFNPYAISAAAISGFQAASISANLNAVNQLFTLTMNASAPVSTSVGGGGGDSVAPPHGFATPGFTIDSPIVNNMRALGLKIHDLVKLPNDGNPLTQSDTTVYYLGIDGRRHAFSSSELYFSWYCDFNNIRLISNEEMAKIPLGRNVAFRPGLRLVKFPSILTVYLVQTGGVLRPIPSEAIAAQLGGSNWNKRVSDISEAFYTDYVIDGPITTVANLRQYDQTPSTISGNLNFDGYEELPLTNVPLCPSLVTALEPFVFTSDLEPGSVDIAAIRRLQQILGVQVTGKYGSQTTTAVRAFQITHGIRATGIVGPLTRAELNALNGSTQK